MQGAIHQLACGSAILMDADTCFTSIFRAPGLRAIVYLQHQAPMAPHHPCARFPLSFCSRRRSLYHALAHIRFMSLCQSFAKHRKRTPAAKKRVI